MLITSICPTIEVPAVSLVSVGAASIWFLAAGNTTLQLAAEHVAPTSLGDDAVSLTEKVE
jgi:hypothetical protein